MKQRWGLRKFGGGLHFKGLRPHLMCQLAQPCTGCHLQPTRWLTFQQQGMLPGAFPRQSTRHTNPPDVWQQHHQRQQQHHSILFLAWTISSSTFSALHVLLCPAMLCCGPSPSVAAADKFHPFMDQQTAVMDRSAASNRRHSGSKVVSPKGMVLGPLDIFVLSAIAKIGATLVTYPMLVVKNRLQVRGGCSVPGAPLYPAVSCTSSAVNCWQMSPMGLLAAHTYMPANTCTVSSFSSSSFV